MCAWRVRAYGSPAFVYDQLSACMHTRVHGMCVSESPLGWEEREEGGSGIYSFVKGSPHPKATSCHRPAGPPEGRCSGAVSSPVSVSVPAPGGQLQTPLHTAGFRPASRLPFPGQEGQALGPLLQAPRVSGRPGWGGAAWQPGRRATLPNHRGSERRLGWKGWGGVSGGLNRCIGPDGPSPGVQARRPALMAPSGRWGGAASRCRLREGWRFAETL